MKFSLYSIFASNLPHPLHPVGFKQISTIMIPQNNLVWLYSQSRKRMGLYCHFFKSK